MASLTEKPCYLCGFMGCGKTTVGKLLAKLLGTEFTDMDAHIERLEGRTIAEIFASDGEEYFRKKETEVLESFGGKSGVIATGGGALLSEQNGEIVKKNGTAIYIDAPFELCYDRIKNDSRRPIVVASTEGQLRERFEQRKPLYSAHSSATVDGRGSPRQIAERIYKLLVEN